MESTYTFAGMQDARDAFPGPYVVGIVVTDLDGNSYEPFVEATVTE